MADVLSKQDVQDVLEVIKQLYLEDRIPWICGYSGGKDSTAIVQLVWMALRQIPKEKESRLFMSSVLTQWLSLLLLQYGLLSL